MMYLLLLLIPTQSHAINAARFAGYMDEAFKICAVAEGYKTTLSQQQPGCVFSKICRESVREQYNPLFKQCAELTTYLGSLANSMKCPKKPELGCRFDRKLQAQAEDMGKELEKAMKKSYKGTKGESVNRGCEDYFIAQEKNQYGTCPSKAEIDMMDDLHKKIMPTAVYPLANLLKKLGRNED